MTQQPTNPKGKWTLPSIALIAISVLGVSADVVAITEASPFTVSPAWLLIGLITGYILASCQAPPKEGA